MNFIKNKLYSYIINMNLKGIICFSFPIKLNIEIRLGQVK